MFRFVQCLLVGVVLVGLTACGGTGGDDATTITHNGTTYGFVTSPYTGKVWLDRNLGAARVCEQFDDSACYGDYYQWGRNFDGHEDSGSGDTSTQATQIDPVQAAVEGKFITDNGTNDYDWAKAVDATGATRTVNWSKTDGSSVCPAGFRVPTITELRAELLDTGSAEIANRDDAFNSFLALPSAGYHSGDSAFMNNVDSSGGVWAASVDGSNSHCLNWGSVDAGWDIDGRAYGWSVRCLRD